MNVLDAAFHLVHDPAHGGSSALAPRMGKTHQALSAEVSGRPGFKLGLVDALNVQLLTGNHRILHAMAAELGEMCVALPQLDAGVQAPCAHKVAALAHKFGVVMAGVAEDMADGLVSDNELGRLEQRGGELIAAWQGLIKHMAAINAAQKAARAEWVARAA